MTIYAGRGLTYPSLQTHYLTKRLIYTDFAAVATHTISLGWLPANSAVVRSYRIVKTVTSSAASLDIGFRNSEEGHTADPDAFSSTILALGTALGVVEGAMTTSALYFTQPAEVTAEIIVGTLLTAGEAYLAVEFINFDNAEDL